MKRKKSGIILSSMPYGQSKPLSGNLTHDDAFAAEMIRESADENSPLKKEKTSSIAKSLRVVLKRFHQSRDERRQSLGGEIVSDENGQ